MTRTVELLVSSLLVVLLIVFGVATMPAADAHPQFDAGRTAQLSIHKTASSTDTAQEPLAGVVFGIQKVNGIDLNSNEGWKELSTLDARDVHSRRSVFGPPARRLPGHGATRAYWRRVLLRGGAVPRTVADEHGRRLEL